MSKEAQRAVHCIGSSVCSLNSQSSSKGASSSSSPGSAKADVWAVSDPAGWHCSEFQIHEPALCSAAAARPAAAQAEHGEQRKGTKTQRQLTDY